MRILSSFNLNSKIFCFTTKTTNRERPSGKQLSEVHSYATSFIVRATTYQRQTKCGIKLLRELGVSIA